MNRGKWTLLAMGITLVGLSGCGFREREGFLARRRARAAMPDCLGGAPVMDGYGATAMPCSLPGGTPFPFSPAPGPGATGMPDYLMPGSAMPPLAPPGAVAPPAGTPPGSATPRPAEPSDPASLRKGTGLATAKPAANP